MWESFHAPKKLLTLQEIILERLEQNWNLQKRHAILCPRQEAVNSTLIQLAISKRVPTLILCNSQDRYREWQNIVINHSNEEEIDKNFTTLSSLNRKTPFIISHYAHFCSDVQINETLKEHARKNWLGELASLGINDFAHKNIGDLDAICEAEKQLNQMQKHDPQAYEHNIMRFVDLEKAQMRFDDSWLNSNFEDTVDLLEDMEIGLVICDDSHEVSGLWAEALYRLMHANPTCHLLSTSPLDMKLLHLSVRDIQLQKLLFSSHPIQLKLSLLVRDNCFKPYRGLFKICRPTENDLDFLHELSDRLHTILQNIEDKDKVSITLTDFALNELSIIEKDIPGQWAHRFEYVQSVLNLLLERNTTFPAIWDLFLDKLTDLSFQHNLPVLKEYIYRVLHCSAIPREVEYAKELIEAFRPLGFNISEFHLIKERSIIPNVISHSISKEAALIETLENEYSTLKDKLRAVVICDFLEESVGTDIFKESKYSNSSCGMLSIFKNIHLSTLTNDINPIIIYDDCIHFSPSLKITLQREIKEHLEAHSANSSFVYRENNDYATIAISHIGDFNKMWPPLLNRLLEKQIVHCLIVGREFLTHRWDGICFNTFLNISTAQSALFGIRLLARILEPGYDPVNSKHLWDFCSIMPETEYGMTDYERISERKSFGWHLCEDGEFEQGINYFHPFLKKQMNNIPQALIQDVNDTANKLITERDQIHGMWTAKHDHDNYSRTILEVAMPKSIDIDQHYVVERDSGNKHVQCTLNNEDLIRDMCLAVIHSIVKINNLQEVPELTLKKRLEGVYRLDISHSSPEIGSMVLKSIDELFAPIHHQHHLITIVFGDETHAGIFLKLFSKPHLDYTTPFAIPECFYKKNDLRQFLYFWHHYVSRSGEMLPHRNPRVRSEVQNMLNNQQRLIRPSCQNCSLLV